MSSKMSVYNNEDMNLRSLYKDNLKLTNITCG